MGNIDLGRRRILVVEDEYILAADIVDQIEDHNGVPLGPVETLELGLEALDGLKPDACIVNINLGREKVYELADLLIERDIPDRFNGVPLHAKPLDMIKAAAALMRTVTQPGE
jgi:CheY-like chemotaxis protein